MRTGAFLRNVPVFADLPDDLLDQLAGQVGEVSVRAGDWILREGDEANSLYVLRSGRVEVLDEGPPEIMLRILRRGDVLGELALLRSGTRSASARARRDTELLELGRDDFERLIQEAPSFALGLTRAMGAQLAVSRTPIHAATPPTTIAVVGLDRGADPAPLAAALTDALEAHGTAVRLDQGDLGAIDRAAQQADRVVLQAGTDPEDPWTDVCVREADLVLALSTGRPERSWLSRAAALAGCELIVYGTGIDARTIDALSPQEVQVLPTHSARADALAATARRLCGRSIGVVLSGGGARALAHLGVIEQLLAEGVRFDRIGGVSLGSLIAAGFAAGYTPEEAYEAAVARFVEANPSNDFALPVYSLIRGAKSRRNLQDLFGERRIEELPLRFFALSCDLITRSPVVHRTGRIADAVYPSLAIPAVFPPVATDDGRLLVDGGVLDNLPVATMASTGEGPVIAVDVTGRMGQFRSVQRGALGRLGPPLRRALTGSERELPRLSETVMRTVMVGSADTVMSARLHADLVITPQVEGIALMDWKALPRVRELGREAARAALAANPNFGAPR